MEIKAAQVAPLTKATEEISTLDGYRHSKSRVISLPMMTKFKSSAVRLKSIISITLRTWVCTQSKLNRVIRPRIQLRILWWQWTQNNSWFLIGLPNPTINKQPKRKTPSIGTLNSAKSKEAGIKLVLASLIRLKEVTKKVVVTEFIRTLSERKAIIKNRQSNFDGSKSTFLYIYQIGTQ